MTGPNDSQTNAIDTDIQKDLTTEGTAEIGEVSPSETVLNYWERVMEDMEATKVGYEDSGWHVKLLHPGDITLLTGDGGRTGIDVLLPDNEFEQLTDLFDEGLSLNDYQVFKNGKKETVFMIVALEDSGQQTVVLLPLYYSTCDAAPLFRQAYSEGILRIYLRTLSGESVVLSYRDPDLLAPPEDM